MTKPANKVITLQQAAGLVHSGNMLAFGGMTNYRRPLSFVRALIQRQAAEPGLGDLTLLNFTSGLESDLLVGAGLVRRVRTCYFGLEIFGLAPMFTYYAGQGEIDVLEESEASLAFGLRAQMAQVGFMPGRGWLGTDMLRLRPDVRTVIDPYSGEELVAFPAIQPDIAVIHALRADLDGNASIGANKGVDEELAVAARTVIITAEEIVPQLHQAEIPAPFVDYVAPAPRGAAPTSCHPLYALDGAALLEYTSRVSDPDSFSKYIQAWLA